MQVPVALWSKGVGGRPDPDFQLLDGRNRLDAAELVGLTVHWNASSGEMSLLNGRHRLQLGAMTTHLFELRPGLALGNCKPVNAKWIDPYDYVLSANIHRRHLTADQKRELIAKVIEANPHRSDRQIGEQVKADHKTVGSIRKVIEDVGRVPHVATRQDTRGRAQPSHKPPSRKPAPRDERAGTRRRSRFRQAVVAEIQHAPRSRSGRDRSAVAKMLFDGPTTVKKLASKLNGGVAPTYVTGLLEGLADRPLYGFAAKMVKGVGNDATWEISKVEDAEVLPAEPKTGPAERQDSEELGKIVAAMLVIGAAKIAAPPASLATSWK